MIISTMDPKKAQYSRPSGEVNLNDRARTVFASTQCYGKRMDEIEDLKRSMITETAAETHGKGRGSRIKHREWWRQHEIGRFLLAVIDNQIYSVCCAYQVRPRMLVCILQGYSTRHLR